MYSIVHRDRSASNDYVLSTIGRQDARNGSHHTDSDDLQDRVLCSVPVLAGSPLHTECREIRLQCRGRCLRLLR